MPKLGVLFLFSTPFSLVTRDGAGGGGLTDRRHTPLAAHAVTKELLENASNFRSHRSLLPSGDREIHGSKTESATFDEDVRLSLCQEQVA